MELFDSGTIAGADWSAGYVAVATLPAPVIADDGAGAAFTYTLVVRFTGLHAAHQLRVRRTQGAAVEYADADANGQAVDEVVYDEILGAGEADVSVAVTATAGPSVDADAAWFLYRTADASPGTVPNPPATADAYYAKDQLVRAMGGDEAFNAEFRLDPGGLTADPDMVALAIKLADNTVESIAYKVGLEKLTTGPGTGWAVAPDDEPVYTECSLWAARWARAQAHAFQPENNPDPGDRDDVEGTPPDGQAGQPEAGFVGARREAERRIKEILKAKYERFKRAEAVPQLGDDIIAVGWNDRCGALPLGTDPNIVYRR
jgi:hypothetical protein